MLKVAVTGASGLVGTPLSALLESQGHTVVPMKRSSTDGRDGSIAWSPETGVIHPERLESVDVIVHLAGENIAAGRWTELAWASGTRLVHVASQLSAARPGTR